MIKAIVTGIVIILIAAFFRNLWIHRKESNRMLGGYPSSFWGWIRSKLKKKETEEEKKNREYREEMESDDPEKWKPVN